MHELAIIQKIVVAVSQAAEKNGIKSVKRIRLKLGQMAAAHPEQLSFGFKTYAKGSRLDDAELLIEEIKMVLECQRCRTPFGDERFNDHDFAHTIAHAPLTYIPPNCPKCGNADVHIKKGQEMELVDIEGE